MAEELEPLTTAQVIEHLDYVQDVVRDEIKFPDKLLNEDHWQMIANALDRLRELDTANGKLGQRATKAEHNCASARALAKQSLERWVALEAENAQLKTRLLDQQEFEIQKVEFKIRKRVLDQMMKNEREYSEYLKAQNAELLKARETEPMSEAPMNGSGFWAVDDRGRWFRLRGLGHGWECAYLPFNPMRHEMVGCRP